MYWYWDNTFLILIPGLLLALYAQIRISSTYSKYNEIKNAKGISGYEAARMILDRNGMNHVQIQTIGGKLSDNFDPRTNTLNLSEKVSKERTIAAISIAAHECGHALQHQENYGPIRLRSVLVPVVRVSSILSWILIIAGYVMGILGMTTIGIIFFSTMVVFQLVTLPVEFNASQRALVQLEATGIATQTEAYGAKKVLNAAAFTYVAATLVALLQLFRIIMLFGGRRR